MSNQKRQYKELSLGEKLNLIETAETERLSQRQLGEKFNISKTQVQRILASKSTVKETVENFGSLKRKRVASCTKYGVLDEKLIQWVMMARSKNLPISGTLLQSKALKMGELLNLTDFSASNGWLQKFKDRHNLHFVSLSGEGSSVNMVVVENYRDTLVALTHNYEPKNIFNLDETGLFFRATPSRTLQLKNEKCIGGKMCKERLTVALLCNMVGEKEPLVVIGKARRPRAFKNLNIEDTFDISWRYNKKAWMTSIIFQEWMNNFNKKMSKQKRKVILFLDNAPCHPDKQYSNVKLQFFPPNTTSSLQPLDQGIIRSCKIHYRNLLMNRLVVAIDESNGVEDLSKKINVLDACSWLTEAWNKVTPGTISNCFIKAGFGDGRQETQTEAVVESNGIEEDCLGFDENLQIFDELPNNWEEDLFLSLSSPPQNVSAYESSSSDGDKSIVEEVAPTSLFSFVEVQKNLQQLKNYASAKGLDEMFFHLQKSEQKLIEKEISLKKVQTKITSYFTQPASI